MPISQLQPTPQEEVENAIDADNAKAAEPELSEQTSASAGEFNAQDPAPQNEGQFAIPKGREHRITQPKPTVYIGNLFFDVTEDDLSRELSRFGKIKKLRLLRDSRGLSKGSVPILYQLALC